MNKKTKESKVEFFLNFHFIFLLFSFIISLYLSYISKFEFYNISWHYITTPIGLIHGKFSSNTQLNYFYSYLSSLNSTFEFSIIQIFTVFTLIFISILYLLYIKKSGGIKC